MSMLRTLLPSLGNKSLPLALLLGSLAIFSTSLWAAKSPVLSPESIDGTTKVSAEGLIEVVGKIPDIILVDSRIHGDRKQGYVEGSISLPDIDTTCETLANIIPKKGSPTLFYCNGIKCGRSVKAIKVAKSCGYNNIYWFRGGFEEWLAKGYPFQQE